jgi:hypothetical protein
MVAAEMAPVVVAEPLAVAVVAVEVVVAVAVAVVQAMSLWLPLAPTLASALVTCA